MLSHVTAFLVGWTLLCCSAYAEQPCKQTAAYYTALIKETTIAVDRCRGEWRSNRQGGENCEVANRAPIEEVIECFGFLHAEFQESDSATMPEHLVKLFAAIVDFEESLTEAEAAKTIFGSE